MQKLPRKAALLSLGLSFSALAAPTGLKPLTSSELTHMRNNLGVKKIKEVKPTKLGLERINLERSRRGLTQLPDTQAVKPGRDTEVELAGETSAEPQIYAGVLPAAVDNSTMAAFPPIGNQAWNSCVGWAMGYYQNTHNNALAMNYNAKGDITKRCSPKQIYNMINAGVDQGAYFADGQNMLANHGCITMDKFPEDGDYRGWNLNPEHWRGALPWRSNPYQYLQGIDTEAGLSQVKQLLTNGYVLTFGTYINSWQYTTIKTNPFAASPLAGQKVMHYVSGTQGSHAMTIVGYDDNAWVDVNANNVVDAGELGVLKIANSWGTAWGNAGYIWMAYDALKTYSAVSGAPSYNRGPAIQYASVFHQPVKSAAGVAYAPKFLAKFTLNHALRNQMSLKFGWSDPAYSYATSTYTPFAFINKAGPYAFNGTSTAVDGTFIVDVSSLPISTTSTNKMYMTLTDNTSGSAGSLKSFEVIDVVNNTQGAASLFSPLVADASSVTSSLSYTRTTANQSPIASFTASTTNGLAPLAINFDASSAYDPDGTITAYNWNFGDGSSASGAFASHTFNAGTYTVTLTVIDNSGTTATSTKTVTVTAPVAPTDTTAPTVTLTSPMNGAVYARRSTVTAAASATDNVGVNRVKFYVSGNLKCTDYTAPYSCSFSMPRGTSISVKAYAYDAAGNYSVSNIAYIRN